MCIEVSIKVWKENTLICPHYAPRRNFPAALFSQLPQLRKFLSILFCFISPPALKAVFLLGEQALVKALVLIDYYYDRVWIGINVDYQLYPDHI